MALDTAVFFFLNGFAGQSPVLDGVIVFFASYLAYAMAGILLVLLLLLPFSLKEKLTVFFTAIIAGVVARFGAVELIRFAYERPRPFVDLEVTQLLPHTAWSFPSGHAAFFFALATVVYLYNKKMGLTFFLLAALIGLARVSAGIHYPSDILGGALVGALVGYIVFKIGQFLTRKEAN